VVAIRPRNRTVKEICSSCQTDFTKDQRSVSKARTNQAVRRTKLKLKSVRRRQRTRASILEGEAAGLASEFEKKTTNEGQWDNSSRRWTELWIVH